MRATGRFKRALQLETLETRRVFAIEVSLQPPIVSAFSAFAEVRGLNAEQSAQPVTTLTIDNAGVRQAIKEINGTLYSFQGNSVFLTDSATGVTQSRTLTGLAGTSGVQIRDVALVNDEVVYVGGSVTGNTAPTKSTIPTRWDANGTPTRVGPAGKTGLATFILPEGLIGGYYEKVANEYQPWLHTPLGDFDLPGGSSPSNPQMVTGGSSGGYFLIGFENNNPMLWSSEAAPETGAYNLELSTDVPFDYPQAATLGPAGKNFKIFEDNTGSIGIFGQYERGTESHAGMWSITGALLHDFGPNTEMLGAQVVGSTYIVAHRNSVSFVNAADQQDVSTKTLDELLGSTPPAGTTRRILADALLLAGTQDAPVLGLNYSETTQAGTRNRLALIALKTPDQVELDTNNDGVWDDVFFGLEMMHPSFEPLGYGQKTLPVRVTYSDGSTATASATYESLRFETVQSESSNATELQIGGTAAADTATVTKLTDRSYRVSIAGQTRDFSNIDNVLVRLSNESDTLVMAGGMDLEMTGLAGIETIDMRATTAERLSSVDTINVESQVGPTGTMLIQAGVEDTIDLTSGWKVEAPQVIGGRAVATLTGDGKTLLLQTGNYTNPLNSLDTTFDNVVSARDALLVINYLNTISGGGTIAIDAYLDTNNNGVISALDVLLIINDINSRTGGEGEPDLVHSGLAVAAPAVQIASPIDIEEGPTRRRRLF